MLLCLPFADGALKGHFGKVFLASPPLSVVMTVLCLQHVREFDLWQIQGCEVSMSVRCTYDDSLDPVIPALTIPT